MSQVVAENIIGFAVIYGAIGLLFSLAFVMFGWNKVTPAPATGTFLFRFVLIPGSTLLWPWLLSRWVAQSWRGKDRIVNIGTLRRRALIFWLVLTPIAVAIFIAAVLLRPDRDASSYTKPISETSMTSVENSGGTLREH